MPHRLTLIASPDVGTEILPDILVHFRRRYPQVYIDVELTVSPPSITDQKFDLAIWGGPLPTSNLICTTLQNADFGLFAAQSYLESSGVPQVPKDLEEHSCVLLRADHTNRSWKLLSDDDRVTVTPPRSFGANDMAFLRNTVLHGGGIAPMPLVMARHWEAVGQLVRVLPDYRMKGLPLYLLQPSRHFSTEAAEQLKADIIGWHRKPEG